MIKLSIVSHTETEVVIEVKNDQTDKPGKVVFEHNTMKKEDAVAFVEKFIADKKKQLLFLQTMIAAELIDAEKTLEDITYTIL